MYLRRAVVVRQGDLYVRLVTEPIALLASARRILGVAERDLERGLAESACLTAHRAAAMATQAWLEARGQAHVSDLVVENVGLSTAADEEVRRAAELLDRHRMDESAPHGAFDGAGDVDHARAVVNAGRRMLRFVEERMGA